MSRARQQTLDELANGCARHLNRDGPRDVPSLLAQIPANTAFDVYGAGGVVEELELEVATLLGKERALFLPTGVMAQQATLRVHADRRGRRNIAFHPLCHLRTHEENAFTRLHALTEVLAGSRFSPLRACVLFGECAESHDRHYQAVAYSSDLTDAQWNLLEPLLVTSSKRGPKHGDDLRHVVDAMLYISHTGCQWRFLPDQFGPWTRVWSQFRRWSRNGTWTRVLTALHASTRTYSCEACGLMLDRDLNAAINLARWKPNKPLTVTPLGPPRVALRSTA